MMMLWLTTMCLCLPLKPLLRAGGDTPTSTVSVMMIEKKPENSTLFVYYLMGVGEETWPMTVHFGCGVGLHTPPGGIGIDESITHIRLARQLHPDTFFINADARIFGATDMCDTVLCRYFSGRDEWCEADVDTIFSNAVRISRRLVRIVDRIESRKQLEPIILRVAAGRRVVTIATHTSIVWSIFTDS